MIKLLTLFISSLLLSPAQVDTRIPDVDPPLAIEKQISNIEHYSFYHYKENFEAFYNAIPNNVIHTEKIIAAILPHHLFVGEEFARLFMHLRTLNPNVIVLIGPNHWDAGDGEMIISQEAFWTPYGTIETDKELGEILASSSLISIEEEPFAKEHSISSITPFIQKEFPDTPILPIILKTSVDSESAARLAHMLHKHLPEDALVLGSIDFSHYQPEIVADFHDTTSLATITNFDFQNIYNLEIDSPATLTTVLSYLKLRNAQNINYSRHTNVASYSGDPTIEETTSHFFLAFGKGEKKENQGMSVLAFGDTIFDRGISEIMENEDMFAPLTDLAGEEKRFFMGNHINMLNLEGPITNSFDEQKKDVVFRQSPHTTEILKEFFFNTVSFANNHTYDFGEEGIKDTIKTIKNSNIDIFGEKEPCIIKHISNNTLALCAFNDTPEILNIDDASLIIQDIDQKVDQTIVSIHWGYEYFNIPIERQEIYAKELIDAGADTIIGHHPHVIQPPDVYKNRPILYSLGNFVFDQDNKALGAGFFFEDNRITLYLYPLAIANGKTDLMEYEERKKVYEEIGRNLVEYETEIEGKYVIE